LEYPAFLRIGTLARGLEGFRRVLWFNRISDSCRSYFVFARTVKVHPSGDLPPSSDDRQSRENLAGAYGGLSRMACDRYKHCPN
jgi:hypothetical protein